jgi:hypothetical protein
MTLNHNQMHREMLATPLSSALVADFEIVVLIHNTSAWRRAG